MVYLDPPYTKRQYASYYHILRRLRTTMSLLSRVSRA
ncbi:MAG: DNA adenine methylase [Collinsella sp.]